MKHYDFLDWITWLFTKYGDFLTQFQDDLALLKYALLIIL